MGFGTLVYGFWDPYKELGLRTFLTLMRVLGALKYLEHTYNKTLKGGGGDLKPKFENGLPHLSLGSKKSCIILFGLIGMYNNI